MLYIETTALSSYMLKKRNSKYYNKTLSITDFEMNKQCWKQKDKFQVSMQFLENFSKEYISKICDLKELFGYTATWKYRNIHQKCSMKKDILGNFAKFTGKHLCQSLFFNKVTGLGLYRPLPAKFLRTPFLQNTSYDCFPK